MNKGNKIYVTFSQVHAHRVNNNKFDKNCIAVILCKDHSHGRDLAFEFFGDKFGTTYYEDAWKESNLTFFPRGYINVNF